MPSFVNEIHGKEVSRYLIFKTIDLKSSRSSFTLEGLARWENLPFSRFTFPLGIISSLEDAFPRYFQTILTCFLFETQFNLTVLRSQQVQSHSFPPELTVSTTCSQALVQLHWNFSGSHEHSSTLCEDGRWFFKLSTSMATPFSYPTTLFFRIDCEQLAI